jgi:hypothetical protein
VSLSPETMLECGALSDLAGQCWKRLSSWTCLYDEAIWSLLPTLRLCNYWLVSVEGVEMHAQATCICHHTILVLDKGERQKCDKDAPIT